MGRDYKGNELRLQGKITDGRPEWRQVVRKKRSQAGDLNEKYPENSNYLLDNLAAQRTKLHIKSLTHSFLFKQVFCLVSNLCDNFIAGGFTHYH